MGAEAAEAMDAYAVEAEFEAMYPYDEVEAEAMDADYAPYVAVEAEAMDPYAVDPYASPSSFLPTPSGAAPPPDIAELAALVPPYIVGEGVEIAPPQPGVMDLPMGFTNTPTATDCALACTALPGCNAASWTGASETFRNPNNCFLKVVDPGCIVPPEAFPIPDFFLLIQVPPSCAPPPPSLHVLLCCMLPLLLQHAALMQRSTGVLSRADVPSQPTAVRRHSVCAQLPASDLLRTAKASSVASCRSVERPLLPECTPGPCKAS